jgi:hypothetical protein
LTCGSILRRLRARGMSGSASKDAGAIGVCARLGARETGLGLQALGAVTGAPVGATRGPLTESTNSWTHAHGRRPRFGYCIWAIVGKEIGA